MDRDTSVILQRLVQQWSEVSTALARMTNAATVDPEDGWAIFRALPSADHNVVKFEVLPVVFNIPERAYHVNSDLFVVVQGQLSVRRDRYVKDEVLATDNFSTRAAYFRLTADGPVHVYGAHYDFALDELGHPIFHSQMRSFAEMWTSVGQRYSIEGPAKDYVSGILQNVRLPSAQMDVFSLVLQICADHLLFANSGPDERAAFNALLEKSTFLKGAGFQAPRMTTEAAFSCYRSRHWYPSLP